MPFPVIEATAHGKNATASTTHTINKPTGTVSGELLLLVVSNDGDGVTSAATASVTGFTELDTAETDVFTQRSTVLARLADGSEGASFTLNLSESEGALWWFYRISNWHGTIANGVEANCVANATGVNPNPPSLTPAAGTQDYLWFAGCGINDDPTISAYPTDYNDNQINDFNINDTRAAICSRNLNASTENPGTFTISLSQRSVTYTIAVRHGSSPGGGGGSLNFFEDDVLMMMPTQRHGQVVTVIG